MTCDIDAVFKMDIVRLVWENKGREGRLYLPIVITLSGGSRIDHIFPFYSL